MSDKPSLETKLLLTLPRAVLRRVGIQNSLLLLLNVLMFGGLSLLVPSFFSPENFEVMAMGFVFEGIMAVGMTMVIIAGGIDLSVSAVLPFSAIIIAFLFKSQFTTVPAILLTYVFALGIGFFNAWMTNTLRVHPFIATLASMLTIRGLALAISNGENVTSDFPADFSFFGQGYVLGIPFPVLLFIVFAVVIGYLLKNHRFFQQVYFIGESPKAAKISGIKVEAFLYFVFALSAVLACTAGILIASRYNNASNSYGLARTSHQPKQGVRTFAYNWFDEN